MTYKGAQVIIESLSIRFAEIQKIKDRLDKEEKALQERAYELSQVQDPVDAIPIVIVNDENC